MAKSAKKIKITVAIPTYNGEEYLYSLLESVFSQDINVGFEVLIIDSGSQDSTLSILSKFPAVRLHEIPNSEFGHGKTRNLAIKMAKGEFVVFLSQDAVPAHSKWLEHMVEPFKLHQDVVCVFGRQEPRAFADATTKREILSVFNSLGPEHSIMLHRKKSLFSGNPMEPALTFFSDVNSAVRKSFLEEKIPYQDVRYAEDQLLGNDVLEAGKLKAYAPRGLVMHSNEYNIGDYYYRKVDENLAMLEVLNVAPNSSWKHMTKRFFIDTARDWIFALQDKSYSVRRKVRNIPGSFIRNFLKQKAAYTVGNPKKRSKIGLTHSLEKRRKS